MGNLICENIRKQFKKHVVLEDVNLTLERGKIYGLLGRNGAGKTTLMSIITAQLPSSGGRVSLDGEDVWENPKALSKIAFAREFQGNTGSLIGNLSVQELLKMGRIYYANWDEEYARKLMEQWKIDKKAIMSTLSQGMRSMVSIILGLASKAEFTFFDEPVAGLDAVAREEFYRMIIEENANTGRTLVISSHILEEASGIFEEVIFLHGGKILYHENVEELLARSYRITGRSDVVDEMVQGHRVYHPQTIGRSKSVTVILEGDETFNEQGEVSIQPETLQSLFVALCQNE
ncbi:MAG: ABC transporter ATP-binding protein [Lachnospiraceae bacterium]|nr:ABC transporter ATP-binding protein [Lachnospiraceae bacterium]